MGGTEVAEVMEEGSEAEGEGDRGGSGGGSEGHGASQTASDELVNPVRRYDTCGPSVRGPCLL